MPKRVPTPPPGDDEPRYLTVVHPYAISGTCNMELRKDREDFARWVACCIDKNAFFSIFHKPSSRGMVIIEIKRDYAHFDRILGEHRWSEFLQAPSEEEMGRVSRVFYCTYNTGRIVQKNGWRRIDVDEAWFKSWSPRNKQITFPYPPTHFCDVPVEDRTNHPLCRPLPGAVKIPPPEVIAAPQPVVGSAEWIQSKGGVAPVVTQDKPNPLGAWGKGAPKTQSTSAKPNPTANGSVKKANGFPQGPLTGSRLPAIGGGPIAVKSSNVWSNTSEKSTPPPVAENWDDPEPASGHTSVSRATSPATSAPPGLPSRQSAWGRGPPSISTTATSADGTGNSSANGWDSTGGASTSSPDSDLRPDLTPATENDNPYAIHINFSESMEEEFHGMHIRAFEDEDGLRELDAIGPITWDNPAAAATWDEPNVGATWNDPTAAATWDGPGWDNEPVDAEDQWRQAQEPKPILCKAHGIICKKGICAEYARQLRLTKRAEEDEKRRAAAAAKGNKGRATGKGRGKKNDDNEQAARNGAPNNQFRGPGAPVRTNWRGAPRAIVSVDAIEKRDMTKGASDDGSDNSDSEVEPNMAAVNVTAAEAASDANWGISEDAYDPWASNAARPTSKAGAKPPGNGRPASNGKPAGVGKQAWGNKKPVQTTASSNWADQVEAELAAGGAGADADAFSVASSKRGKRRTSGSATSTAAKSSTSGWGSVADMPW